MRELSRRWWRGKGGWIGRKRASWISRVTHTSDSYSLCSDEAGTSSAGTCVFCRRRSGMPPPFFGARLGHSAGCTMLMQSVCAFALQPRHRTPWRLWPRSTWPHASHGVILRYVYSRQVCPPSESRLFLRKQSPLFTGPTVSLAKINVRVLPCDRAIINVRHTCACGKSAIKLNKKTYIYPTIKFKSNPPWSNQRFEKNTQANFPF